MIMELSEEECREMVQLDPEKSTQCAVYDQTPDSEQKKINIVVRPAHTVAKVISNIKTQYRYDTFDLVLQPNSGGNLVYLNDRKSDLIYKIDEFEPKAKNTLVLLPTGMWNGNVETRFTVPKVTTKLLTNGNDTKMSRKLSPSTSKTSKKSSPSVTPPSEMATAVPDKKLSPSKTSSAETVKKSLASVTPPSESTVAVPASPSVTPPSEMATAMPVKKLSPSKTSSAETAKKSLASVTPPTESTVAVPAVINTAPAVTPTEPTKKSTSGTPDAEAASAAPVKISTHSATSPAKTATQEAPAEKSSASVISSSESTTASAAVIPAPPPPPFPTTSTITVATLPAPKKTKVKTKIKSSTKSDGTSTKSNSKIKTAEKQIEPNSPMVNEGSNTTATDETNSLDITSKFKNLASFMGELNNGSSTTHDQNQAMTNSNSVNDLMNHENRMSPPSSMTTVTNATNSDSLNLSPMSDPDPLSDDDLALGASASPTEGDTIKLDLERIPDSINSGLYKKSYKRNFYSTYNDETNDAVETEKKYPLSSLPGAIPAPFTVNHGYVGLVNQAMTCYLNSLLQALYMTPEFRNALYRWEFDNDNEAKNIPYQLQKLFLNLQTSKKSAVETTDLTRSFGWNSSEAWQQHDIQELCRVMFDALEHKFKNTKQANLIATLYEGKMLDYVKCLECNTEKQRADTFLDIPLPVRPFGSQTAYGSIEEALRAFVQPETLDGNNQYFCEKCDKKCDAHKGLKFKNFPYVMTLHLKRFDFEYTTMHRIKLNDKVTFPQVLNLNTFIAPSDDMSQQANGNDDGSTTDSGSTMEEDNLSSGVATMASYATQNGHDINEDEPDEGIDISSIIGHRTRSHGEVDLNLVGGPYTYELFAIMIHSGSASGGHYYAYIKEFDNNEWFCFNDQTVNQITQEDIQKSFGGTTSKAYYSSIYSSSTNAYMLMYRQVDESRNEKSVKADEFPEHIIQLLEKLKEEEETRGSRSSVRHRHITDLALPEQIKPRVYFYNPQLKKLKMTRVYVTQTFDISTVLESAYEMLTVKQFAPLCNCRLVGYDPNSDKIIRSFEDIDDRSLTDIRANSDSSLEFLLEYRADEQQFEKYEPGGTTWFVYLVKLNNMEMDGPFFVYSQASENNDTLRQSIINRLNIKDDLLMIKTSQRFRRAFVSYDTVPTKENQDQLEDLVRFQFKNITYFYLNVPNTDPKNLELIGINTSESREQINDNPTDDPALPSNGENAKLSNGFHRECNSEDSSLSDGDRTLVENTQRHGGGGGDGDSQFSSASHSPQLSSPDDENNQDSLNRINAFYNGYSHGDSEQIEILPQKTQFFHAIKLDVMDTTTTTTRGPYIDSDNGEDTARKPVVSYKILVDSHMELRKFKEHVQQLIKVPDEFFQINRKHDMSLKVHMHQSLLYFSDGETLSVQLGKELQPDERIGKVYYMRLSDLNNETGKLPCVCKWIFTEDVRVPEAKIALISKLQRIDPIKYKTLSLENVRLWLNGGRRPVKIFTEDEGLCNTLRASTALDVLVQECAEGQQPQPDDTSLTIFVRHWHPDTLELGKFQEITLDKNSEMRNVLSNISGIPEENIAFTKMNGTFPYTNISLLTINSAMNWYAIPATLDNYPLTNTMSGDLYFYKDYSIELKELTAEERREMNAKEKTRLDRLGCISSTRYSPRRERALKIYLDSPVATASPPVDANSSIADD